MSALGFLRSTVYVLSGPSAGGRSTNRESRTRGWSNFGVDVRFKRFAALAGIGAIVAMMFTGLTPLTASATESTCGYADADGVGQFRESICWFDFSEYDAVAASSDAGQRFETSLGAYEVTFTVTQRSISNWTARSVTAAPSTQSAFVMGRTSYYRNIPGQPFLYANGGQAFGAVRITISDFEVSLGGEPVTGYDLVSASPETPSARAGSRGEWINWDSDQPLTMVDSRTPHNTGSGCVVPLVNDGTTNVWCNPADAGTQAVYGALLAAPSATTISGTLYMSSGGEREALGFGIRTAMVELDKQVNGRVDAADSFDLSVTSNEGPLLGDATTGDNDAATTGLQPVIPSGPITLSETMTSGAPGSLDYYDASWTCENAVDSATELPTGAATSQTATLASANVVRCGITNTAKAPSLELVKSVSPSTAQAGDTVVYSFAVTNTGTLPVDTVTIDETSFSGTGSLSGVECPATELVPDSSTTCEATYTLTQADVDAGLVTNEAVARGQVPGTSATVSSNASTAEVVADGTSMLAVTKAVDLAEAEVGTNVVYTLTATNSGSLSLQNVTLSDENFTGTGALEDLSCDRTTPADLAPGETLTCTTTYQVRDGDTGTITNDVRGTAVDSRGKTLTDLDSAVVTVPDAATLTETASDMTWTLGGAGVLAVLAGILALGIRRAGLR